jgi:hypothetical protein
VTAVADPVDPLALQPVLALAPALLDPAVARRAENRRRLILGALLGMAQFASILDATTLKVLMEEHGYSTPAPRKGRS